MLPFLIYGITFGFSAAVMPGPFLTYLISQSLKNGWRHTLPATFSPLLTDGPIAILMLLVLVHMPPWLELTLKFSGGLFLLYLAVAAMKSWLKYGSNDTGLVLSAQRTVLNAAMVNLLNPNPYLGWGLVLGPLLLSGWREAPAHGIALLVGFYTTMILSTTGIILTFSLTGGMGPRISRNLIAVSAIALACFGFYQLSSGAITLLSR